jgi:hypothetical protein
MNTATETADFRSPNPQPSRPTASGLPWLERVMFEHVELPRLVARRPWHAARAAWFQTAHRSLDVVQAFTPSQLAQPVAIRRLPGLEPRSTRYAAGEVLEHLIIANDRIAEVIAHLRAGEPHPGLKRTDALRPQGRLPMAETPAAFEASLRELDARLAREGTASRLRTPHPFFPKGLDAHEWLVLGWVHQVIHLKQLNAIARALCVNPPARPAFEV